MTDLKAITSELWDVLVVGAGPSGAMAARTLAEGGARVLLVDRAQFPRYKVCGCCLNAHAVSILNESGASEILKEDQVTPLHAFHLAVQNRNATLSLPTGGLALSRSVMDDALAESARNLGATFLDGTLAESISVTDEFRTIRLTRQNEEVRVGAKIVLAAEGLGQVFSRSLSTEETHGATVQKNSFIGAGVLIDDTTSDFEPGVIYMACGKAGYVGLVRLAGDRLNVATALDAKKLREHDGIHELATSIITDAGFPISCFEKSLKWQGTPPLTRRAPSVSGHRYFVLGDAAGYVEPFTGEGMAWALSTGKAIAPFVEQGLGPFTPELSRDWNNSYRNLVRSSHRRCKIMTTGLRSPRLVRATVELLSIAPGIARPFINQLNRPSRLTSSEF